MIVTETRNSQPVAEVDVLNAEVEQFGNEGKAWKFVPKVQSRAIHSSHRVPTAERCYEVFSFSSCRCLQPVLELASLQQLFLL